MNWDHFRIALAVARLGSYSAAARHLKIDETTVARRVTKLEEAMGCALFEAVDGQRRPTPALARVQASLEQIDSEMHWIGKALEEGEDCAGHFRIASTPAFARHILAPALPALLDRYPGLSIELLSGNENLQLSRWEADFAIRLKRPEKGESLVRKLGGMAFVEVGGGEESSPTPVWCAYGEELAHLPESEHLAKQGREVALRASDPDILATFVATGRGAAILPVFIARKLLEQTPELTIRDIDLHREVWLLQQPHLRASTAARTIADWIIQTVASAGLVSTLSRSS